MAVGKRWLLGVVLCVVLSLFLQSVSGVDTNTCCSNPAAYPDVCVNPMEMDFPITQDSCCPQDPEAYTIQEEGYPWDYNDCKNNFFQGDTIVNVCELLDGCVLKGCCCVPETNTSFSSLSQALCLGMGDTMFTPGEFTTDSCVNHCDQISKPSLANYENCLDGVDNDGDTLIDCGDPDCNLQACIECSTGYAIDSNSDGDLDICCHPSLNELSDCDTDGLPETCGSCETPSIVSPSVTTCPAYNSPSTCASHDCKWCIDSTVCVAKTVSCPSQSTPSLGTGCQAGKELLTFTDGWTNEKNADLQTCCNVGDCIDERKTCQDPGLFRSDALCMNKAVYTCNETTSCKRLTQKGTEWECREVEREWKWTKPCHTDGDFCFQGVCLNPEDCNLTSASFNTDTAAQGQTVTLVVTGNEACEGLGIVININEDDWIWDDPVESGLVSQFRGGTATYTWTVPYTAAPILPLNFLRPEYQFNAYVPGNQNTLSSNTLSMSTAPPVTPHTLSASGGCIDDGGSCLTASAFNQLGTAYTITRVGKRVQKTCPTGTTCIMPRPCFAWDEQQQTLVYEQPAADAGDCADCIDNDGDYKIDDEDWGCTSYGEYDAANPDEHSIKQCDDGIDNEQPTPDGLIDFPDDPECLDHKDDSEDSSCSQEIDMYMDAGMNYNINQEHITIEGIPGAIKVSWQLRMVDLGGPPMMQLQDGSNKQLYPFLFRSEYEDGPFVMVDYRDQSREYRYSYEFTDADVQVGNTYYYYMQMGYVGSNGITLQCEKTPIANAQPQCEQGGYWTCDILNPGDCGCCPEQNIYADGTCVEFPCNFETPIVAYSYGVSNCDLPDDQFDFRGEKMHQTYFFLPINALVQSGTNDVLPGDAPDVVRTIFVPHTENGNSYDPCNTGNCNWARTRGIALCDKGTKSCYFDTSCVENIMVSGRAFLRDVNNDGVAGAICMGSPTANVPVPQDFDKTELGSWVDCDAHQTICENQGHETRCGLHWVSLDNYHLDVHDSFAVDGTCCGDDPGEIYSDGACVSSG